MRKKNKSYLVILLLILGLVIFLLLHFKIVQIGCSPTCSMCPTITPKDLIFGFRIFNSSEIKIGDIVTFYEKNYFDRESIPKNWLVVHRIIRFEYSNDTMYYIVKGDNSTDEQIISFDNIRWKVTFICKNCL